MLPVNMNIYDTVEAFIKNFVEHYLEVKVCYTDCSGVVVVHIINLLYERNLPCGGGYKNSTTIIHAVHKRQQNGWSKGSRKLLLCIFSY